MMLIANDITKGTVMIAIGVLQFGLFFGKNSKDDDAVDHDDDDDDDDDTSIHSRRVSSASLPFRLYRMSPSY